MQCLPFGPRSQASLQKAQGPGVCKLAKPPASRALCQAKRAPRAAFPSACLAAQTKRWAEGISVKNLPAMQQTWVRFLGWEDPLEKGMATHSSVLAWRIPGTGAHSQGDDA